MRRVTAGEALESLRRGEELRGIAVSGNLSLHALADGTVVRSPIRIADCHFEGLAGEALRFEAGFSIENTTLGELALTFSYFPGGLEVVDCAVSGPVDFQCGGHNTDGRVFRLERSTFREFVNFFDCWFEAPVLVRGCRFEAGTNLLGNIGAPMQVQFDVAPVTESNTGALDRDGG